MAEMLDEIREKGRDGLVKYMSEEAADMFLSRVDDLLEKYKVKWQLSQLSFMPTYTVNLLFCCDSALYGPCIVKMCISGPEVVTETNCLRDYDGQGYVKLWDYDLSDNVLIMERVTPGTQMWDVDDYKERARLMGQIIKDLPFVKCEQGQYPTYKTWLEGIKSKLIDMSSKEKQHNHIKLNGVEDAIFYLNEALRIYGELKQTYNRNCLLHGDMHQENLLLNHRGGYTIIDPKGVIDDPVMETARFLLNEIPCEKEKIQEMAAIMAPIIGIPEADILKSMFIDAALSNCWTLEEYFPTQEAFYKSKHEALEGINFVYGLL